MVANPGPRSATSTRSRNRIRSRKASKPGAGAGVEQKPGGLAVVEDAQRRTRCDRCGSSRRVSAESPGARPVERLRGERVEPAQAVGAGDREHVAVGEVDDGAPAASARCSASGLP